MTKMTKSPAKLVLGLWLVLMGLVQLLDLSFVGMRPILGILAVAAGILVVLRD
jgi:hypothetical protein